MGDPDAEDALAKWTLFLQEYAKGNEQPPPPPLRSTNSATSTKSRELPSFEVPLYPPGEISRETARTIAEFYDEHGFLPPPRADEESVRLQTIQEYNLFREDQAENFHRSASLVNTFFDFAPVCTISLFHHDVQVVVSKSGDFPVQLGEGLVTETSICGHVVLKKNGETTELNEVTRDWRFAGNPWAGISNGVKGYVGVPITLEVDPSNPLHSERVTVGVLALMSNRTLPTFTVTQRKVLNDLCTMLSVQLRSTWEGLRRGKEARLRNAVSLFLEAALVEPSTKAMVNTVVMTGPPVQGSGSGRNTPRSEAMVLTSNLFSNAAQQIQELLEADFVIIIDLTSFRATRTNVRSQRSNRWTADGRHSKMKTRLTKWILGSSGSPAYDGHEKNFDTLEALAAIGRFLDMYFVTGRSAFPGSGSLSGFEEFLAVSSSSFSPEAARGSKTFGVSGAVPHLALPFFCATQPNLLILVASSSPFFSFNPSDVTFVSNMGVVLLAHRAQNVIVEADAAKTAFVSQISHELRTPLHGLLGQLDLLRDSFSSGDLSVVPTLLNSAEYCGAALRDIIDDVLDFGKMTQSSPGDGANNAARPRVLAELAEITLETSRSCWLRRLQWHSESGSSSSPQSGVEAPPVKLMVEYEDRSMFNNWWIRVDVSGFTRILNNLITNSLKYTAEGFVTVSLTSGMEDGTNNKQVTLRVEDTGRGIAPEFLDRLYEPFMQADSFSPGAGLGLHISKSVVDRMQGTINVDSQLGVGSCFTVVLPVQDIEVAPSGTPLQMRRQHISPVPAPRSKPEPRPVSLVLDDVPPSPQCSPSPTPPPLPQTLATSSESKANAVGEDRTQITSPPSPNHDPAASSPTQNLATPSESKTNGAGEDEHLRILVVDDNAISRKILVAMLKRLNATAYQADDGLAALDVFKEVHPHAVWTDISMPRMDGVTSAKEMRRMEREKGWSPSHIVAITGLGLSDENIRQEALLGPAALDAWLIKGQTTMSSLKESLVAVRHKLISQSGHC
ncbi:hypothetical protein FB451DRAFT_1229641 [Mycena latifolia]|nr:hypothetical protein FB451DRAFT_1229641 [Mycena latifolia]